MFCGCLPWLQRALGKWEGAAAPGGGEGTEGSEVRISYRFQGKDTVTQPVFDPVAGWRSETKTTSWPTTGRGYSILLTTISNPTTNWEYSVCSSGTITVVVEWISASPRPEFIYLKVDSQTSGSHTFMSPANGNASDGLGDPMFKIEGLPSVWSSTYQSGGTRIIKLMLPSQTVELPIQVNAEATGNQILGNQIGTVTNSIVVKAERTDRFVQLTSNLDPTAYRVVGSDGVGIAKLNVADLVGNMYGDTVVSIRPNPQAPPLSASFDFNVQRQLGGAWHYGGDNLFNEWWCNYPNKYWCDGPFSENTWIPISYEFGDGSGLISVESLVSGPFTDRVKYQVTDQVDNHVGEARYFMRLHLPLEKTGTLWRSDYSGDLSNAPEVGNGFPWTTIASLANGSPIPFTVDIKVENRRTYKYVASTKEDARLELDLKVLALHFGKEEEASTEELYEMGATIQAQFTLSPGFRVKCYAIPLGTVEYPLMSEWGVRGYLQDMGFSSPKPGAPKFDLLVEIKPI